MPRVSVLLPARNAAATLTVAARSVLAEEIDLELVVVDDGSTDGTAEVLQRLEAEDSRVRKVTTAGLGLVGALRVGLSLCRADYIARMDADDESLPGRIRRSVEALDADSSLAAVGTGVEIFREDRPPSPNMRAYAQWLSSLTTPERLFADRFVESPLCHPATTLRRSMLEAVGGWEEGDFPEDWQLWLKLLAHGARLVCLPEVLFRWRDHEARLTRTANRYALHRHLWLKAHFLATTTLPVGRPIVVWGAGEVGLVLARLLRDEGVEVARFVDVHPKKIGQRIDGVPVVAPAALDAPGELHLVAAVGAKGARAEIRTFLTARGWEEGRHFTCAA
ncbi:MAG: glycosyltransferase [Myxococcota bacterium]